MEIFGTKKPVSGSLTTGKVINTAVGSNVHEQRADTASTSSADMRSFTTMFPPMELCTRLSPPPIPPWLLDTPDRIRHLVSNCTSWNKYAGMCSLQAVPEYPQALTVLQRDTTVIQWLPLIIALLIALIIVTCFGVLYYLYTIHKIKLDFLEENKKTGRCNFFTSRKKGTVTASISKVSLDNECYSGLTVPLFVNDAAQRQSGAVRVSTVGGSGLYSSPWYNSQGIMLLPERLVNNDDIQSPVYATELSWCDYPSSHSLPIDADCEILLTTTKQKSKSFVTRLASLVPFHKEILKQEEDCPYVSKRFHKNSGRCYFRNKRMITAPEVIDLCRKSGSSLIQVVAKWGRRSGYALADRAKSVPALLRLRRSSVYKTYSKKYRPDHRVNIIESLQSSDAVMIHAETVTDGHCLAYADNNSTTNSTRIHSESSDIFASHTVQKRLRYFGHLLRYGHKRKSARSQVTGYGRPRNSQVPVTFLNQAYASHHGSDIKLTKPMLNDLNMTRLGSRTLFLETKNRPIAPIQACRKRRVRRVGNRAGNRV